MATGIHVGPAVACCWDVVVVFALVCSDHGLEVVRGPLDVLSDIAAGACALVVTPAPNVMEYLVGRFRNERIE